ncbi:quinone oxidoreductase [Limibaculum sp. M0105]|uniref:Quinone oxidoreductase n=1 Tax=Thermohalobaculum xanthum TaxID=2753746 RepID=A0A8J7SFQ8_9RHOB|nr:quinone oxidoreductase [Thermohalobaculum xanthum]MBK0400528.1 quinone oxidoreductase [Thermohalobaculum xanthum]
MAQVAGIKIAEFGGPEKMSFTRWETPTPGEGEILVRHEAIGVNFIDTYHRTGLYAVPLPSGIGLEAAGTVEAVGPGVSSPAVGDRVAYCSGPIGAYAEAHVIKADRCVTLPDWLASETIAASMLKGLTSQYLIRQIHRCGPDDTVLFHAGAGGVGQIAVQWLKHLGSTVIATAGGAEKCAIARALGADHVIDYRSEKVAPRVREITGGKGVRVVYDGVGKDTWLESLDSLQTRGLMVSFGNASGPVTGVDVGILAAKGSLFLTRPTLVHYTATRESLQGAADDYFAALKSGAVKIADPTVYALKDAVQAHTDLQGRKTTGSLILKP